MQDIPQETHHETTRLTQSAQVVLWEIDLTVGRIPFRGRDLN